MAVVDGKFLRGIAGNHVLKKYRGKQTLGMKPYLPKERLTVGTLKAAKTFGIASVLAKQIRDGLDPLIMELYDGTMIYRLNTQNLYCLNGVKDPETQKFSFHAESFERLKGFDFNADSPFKNSLIAQPSITHTNTALQVVLPEMSPSKDLRFPKDTIRCEFVVTVVALDLINGRYNSLPAQSAEIENSATGKAFPGHVFEFAAQPGCLCITAASLRFFRNTVNTDRCINTRDFSPAAILDAFVFDGLPEPQNEQLWARFASNKLTWTEAVEHQG